MYAKTIRPFLPSIDFERSKAFYKELGFETTYEEANLVIMNSGDASFFLQNAYLKEWAENTMVQLFVDDFDVLHALAMRLATRYPEIMVKPVFTAHYGRTFHMIGPEGVLWHVMASN